MYIICETNLNFIIIISLDRFYIQMPYDRFDKITISRKL